MASRWEEINNNPERISKLKRFEKDFDWSGIEFLVSVKDIKKFEFRNQISINLLVIEDKQICICRKRGNYEHTNKPNANYRKQQETLCGNQIP